MSAEARNKATNNLLTQLQGFSNEQDVSAFCQMTLIICSKIIHGIEGEEFKKEFLTAAMGDPEKITIHKSAAH